MVKKNIIVIFVLFIANIAFSQNEDANVISYYAIGNSLDGQPLIEKQNLLRFYPIFKLRDVTNKARVTVYTGPSVFTRDAEKKEDGRYWEMSLPPFHLDEAIQRIDVETEYNLNFDEYKALLDSLNSLKKQVNFLENSLDSSVKEIKVKLNNFNKALMDLKPDIVLNNESYINLNNKFEKVKNQLYNVENTILTPKISFLQVQNNTNNLNDLQTFIKDLESEIVDLQNKQILKKESLDKLVSELNYLRSSIDNLYFERIKNFAQDIITIFETQTNFKKNYKKDIIEQINKEAGKSQTSLTESDIKIEFIEEEEKIINIKVRMLYRNYKKELRQLVSLDPAEKSGIFRIRYIPFPIVGSTLFKPLQTNSTYVFEVGIGFGNISYSGDDFVKPTIAFERLGVAFAISNKLFNNDAKILALALTYDFNAYASIGVGANFKTISDNPEDDNLVKPYYSFGINKGAFEALVKSLNKLFN